MSNDVEDWMALVRQARDWLSSADRKINSAGGLFKVANNGVELGANSWASNVENFLHNSSITLDELLEAMEASRFRSEDRRGNGGGCIEAMKQVWQVPEQSVGAMTGKWTKEEPNCINYSYDRGKTWVPLKKFSAQPDRMTAWFDLWLPRRFLRWGPLKRRGTWVGIKGE